MKESTAYAMLSVRNERLKFSPTRNSQIIQRLVLTRQSTVISLPESIKVELLPNTSQITEPMERGQKIPSGAMD